jgi:hypothetical protein
MVSIFASQDTTWLIISQRSKGFKLEAPIILKWREYNVIVASYN